MRPCLESDARRGAIDEPQASRRDVLKSTAMLAAASSPIGAFLMPQPAAAVMGMTAGRVPGLSAPDADGYQVRTKGHLSLSTIVASDDYAPPN